MTLCSALWRYSSSSAEPTTQQVWRADGYGEVFALQGDLLRRYETTEISCVSGESMTRTGSADANGAQGFGSEGAAEATLRPGPGGTTIYREIGTVSEIDLTPIAALPPACRTKPARDPLTTFDVFWATVNENYNSLHRRDVDWDAMRDRYRPTITEQTENRELFATLKAMLEPLGDMHTGLSDGDDRDFEGRRPGTVEIEPETTDLATDRFLLTKGATNRVTFADGKLVYADLPGGRGYLRIGAFEELSED